MKHLTTLLLIISMGFSIANAQQTVIIVYKTHFDIGYSSTVRDVVHEYRTEMVDRVLEAIEKNSHQPKENQFVWTVSGWPMKQMLWEGQAPERRHKIEQAIRDGNLVIHAYPFTTHTETAEMEDLVRGLGISSRISRQFGQPLSVSAKMSDVPGQSWIIPTLFTHAGIKFYHMGGPVVNMEHGLPLMFWWEGPDGSRLLTLYNNGYGSSQLPPGDWPYKTWIYINMTGDNAGPPDPETVKRDLAFYREKGIEAKVGSMDDFANLILQEDLSKLPVVRSDIGDVWIHGMMSQPAASKMAHNIRPEIGGLDQLTTLQKSWGIYTTDISADISKAYEKSMLYSEHTWGLANQHYLKIPYGPDWDALWQQGLPPQYRMMEGSWKDQAGFIGSVGDLVAEPYADAVATLADHVDVEGPRIVVYNPLPWTRDGEVVMDTRILPKFKSLIPVDGGEAVAFSPEFPALENPAPVSRFLVKDIPPMGYRTFVASQEISETARLIADEKSGIIESPYFKATLDAKRGRIVSLVDKRSGKELVDPDAPQGFGQYFYERFGYKELSDWLAKSLYPQYLGHRFCFVAYDMPQDSVYRSALPENMVLTVRQSPIDVSAVMTGTIPGPGQPQRISIRLTLPAGEPAADLEVSWQKQPDGWPEAGWISLPFRIDNPEFRLGRVGAVMDPLKDFNVDNSNYYMSWINNGIAIFNRNTGAGVGLCPEDSPVISLGVPGEYKFDKRYEPAKPYVYINLYNNHWRTNFVAWIGNGERMSSRVRLWSFEKFDPESSLYTPAMEARVPLKASRSRSNPGKLPAAQSGITLSRKGIAVTAFGPNPDGQGTLLRIWEQAGITGKVEVTLPAGAGFTGATPVNLRGRKIGEPVRVTNGILSFELKANSPASFVLNEIRDEARMQWWRDARFGLFIHWDMSSLAGTEISWSRLGPKPLDGSWGSPPGTGGDPVYDNLYKQFNPKEFDARKWVDIAKNAGMKYIVFTTKHHGGFSMWNTRYSNYSIMNTPFGRDVVKELAEACHEAGLRFGIYYSPRDWYHPDYGVGDNSKYEAFMTGQLTELLTNYGPVDVVWFDSFGTGESINYWHADQVLELVRKLQPRTIINNRCSFFAEFVPSLQGDFDTPEQTIGAYQTNRDWESCMCIVDAPDGGWSYRPDGTVKPFDECIRNLVSCATGDGNLLLDVGPDATGVIPADQADRLAEIGEWMRNYGEAIYGTSGGPFRNGAWGGGTFKDNKVYIHLFDSAPELIELPELKQKLVSWRNLTGSKVTVTEKNGRIILKGKSKDRVSPVTIIEMIFNGVVERVDLQ